MLLVKAKRKNDDDDDRAINEGVRHVLIGCQENMRNADDGQQRVSDLDKAKPKTPSERGVI